MTLPDTKKSSTLSALLEPRGGGLSAMDALFNRLDGMYPIRWRAAFASEAAVANWREAWALAFADEGVTLDGVAQGLRLCRMRMDWPPSLPEFLKLCVATVDAEAAWHEAQQQMRRRHADGGDVWSHPAVFWAAADMGTFDLFNGAWQRSESRWRRLLAARLAGDCPPVPAVALALPAPGASTPDPEAIARLLAGARAVLKRVPDGKVVA